MALRSEWDVFLRQLAPLYAYDLDEIDPALAKAKAQHGEGLVLVLGPHEFWRSLQLFLVICI